MMIDYWLFEIPISYVYHVLYEAKKVAPLYLDECAVLNRKIGYYFWLYACNSLLWKEIKKFEIFYFCF